MGMPRPARFDRHTVLQAGLDLADTRGLQAVTMQAVADRVGVSPMALYRQVAGKADLLDGLVELLLTESPVAAEGLPWDERLTAMAAGLRRTAHRHPAVFPLLLQRPASTPGSTRVRETIYVALAEAAVPQNRIASVERLISTAVLGFLASETGGRLSHHPRPVLEGDYARLMDMLRTFIGDQSGS